MNASDFTTTIIVEQNPSEAFKAIKNVSGWWSEEVLGNTEKINDEFSYHYRDVHSCRMKMIELIPEKKIVWLVLDNYFKFTNAQSEWKDTKVSFEISESENKTIIRFTHLGLIPAHECFDVCSKAWTQYIQQSLYRLITTGIGQPNNKETPRTEHEKILQHASN